MKNNPGKISLSYGSGGKLMHELIKGLYLKYLSNPFLNKLTDAALAPIRGSEIVFTTDSFVVKPLFFPGADIGKLAVAGTVNDLLMLGGIARYISLSFIIQEDFAFSDLEKIVRSVSIACKKCAVKIVTGDTKVVDRNSCDGIFINTSGIGEKIKFSQLDYDRIKEGDAIIINGVIANHGLSVISAREDLDFNIKSDCESLEDIVIPLLKEFKTAIHFMRDPTRGGLATTLNEISQATGKGIAIEEARLPIAREVRTACEILGFDPLYMANEGKVVMLVSRQVAIDVLKFLKKKRMARQAAIIGAVRSELPGKVIAKTIAGGFRIIEMRDGDPLPRIC